MINCLSYALRFWAAHPTYRIWYNGDHAINLEGRIQTMQPPRYVPMEEWGLKHMLTSFDGLLDEYEESLLRDYFKTYA
jgi:hypothetical protein